MQRDLYRYNSTNRLAFLLLIILAFSGLVFLLLSPGRIVIKGIRRFSISLHSQLLADYSPDLRATLLPPVEMALIGEALEDRNQSLDLPNFFEGLTTPVPIVTPPAGGVLPTPPIFPTLPILLPSATANPSNPTGTPSLTPTSTFLPTLTRTLLPPDPTDTRTATVPATPTFTTIPPSRTPAPPTPGYPPPPTDTPVPPTSTPVPNQPTNTPNPPTPTPCPYPYC